MRKGTHNLIARAIAVVLAFAPALVQCSGNSSNTPSPDASASGSSSGNGIGTGSGGTGTGSTANTGAASGTGTSGSSGMSTSGGGGSGGSGMASSGDGGGSSGDATSDAPMQTLCTSPGVPAGCVQCLSAANCPTSAPHCLNGSCVACASSADCGNGTTPVCWPGNHTCHAACSAEGGASPCPTTPGQPSICDTTTGACVGCRTASDCSTAAPVCDSNTQRCVQCQSDSNCSGTTPHCDPTNQTCVVCVTNADCAGSTGGPICRTVTGGPGTPPTQACQPGCTSNAQCTDAGASICDTNGNCVQCVDDSTCSGATPVCDPSTLDPVYHHCVACVPPAYGSDASTLGCDGGPTSCYYNYTTGHYACR